MCNDGTRGFLALAASFVSAAALGAVTSANAVGVLRVDSTVRRTIVAVPWEAVGGGEARALDIVSSKGLTPGDKVFVYSQSGKAKGVHSAYSLQSGAWDAMPVVTADGVWKGDGTETLPRGGAFQLWRSDASKPFVLCGQAPEDAADAVEVDPGTPAKPAYSMLGSPRTEPFVLNAEGAVENPNEGDRIVVPQTGGDRVYEWRAADGWGYDAKVAHTAEVAGRVVTGYRTARKTDGEMSVPVGTGFWYVSTGSGTRINW